MSKEFWPIRVFVAAQKVVKVGSFFNRYETTVHGYMVHTFYQDWYQVRDGVLEIFQEGSLVGRFGPGQYHHFVVDPKPIGRHIMHFKQGDITEAGFTA